MDIVKKHLFSIICGGVALLAVVAAFWPMNGLFLTLNSDLSKSHDNYNQFTSINREKHKMPVVDFEKPEAEELAEFPTQRVIDRGKEIVAKVHEETEKLSQKSLDMNRHQALLPSALPDAKGSNSVLDDFKRRYYRAMEDFKHQLNATLPPNGEEVAKEIERRRVDVWEKQIQTINGQRVNEQDIMAKMEEEKITLPLQMKIDRSQRFSMYISSEKSFDYHPGIPKVDDPQYPDIIDVWIAQLSLWIQQDVVAAIAETNRGDGTKPINVDNSIVKRLWGIDIRKEYVTKTGITAISNASPFQNDPKNSATQLPPLEDPTAPLTKQYGLSITGRTCNPVYDVMQFTLKTDVDARYFPKFMANLTRNRFITILRADVKGVDRDKAQAKGYVYGKAPVVQLVLKCEAVFFRDWTRPMMPVGVQKLLGIAPPLAPVAAQ
jgi:hypothetical protein